MGVHSVIIILPLVVPRPPSSSCFRFPLFGGWQTRYYIGYNVPTYEYLYHSGSHFVLKMRFVDHIFDDQVIDEAKLKVILPEGAKCVGLVVHVNCRFVVHNLLHTCNTSLCPYFTHTLHTPLFDAYNTQEHCL